MTSREFVLQMTTEEKAAMLTGLDHWRLKPSERLGLPKIAVSDGPHGLRKQSDRPGAGNDESKVAVCFPSGAGLASSFNRDLLRELGQTLALEARAENVHVILGPAINMKRSPLCGRNFEYLSEDPYLAGELASSYTDGSQAKGVGVCLKHYAVNSQETRRKTVSAVLDERTLREIYLTAFEKAVKQSKPWTIMAAYNKLNGTYCTQNKHLLTEILRDEWGFDGLVMSDWYAVSERAKGVAAGCDLEMPSSKEENTKVILEAIETAALSDNDLNACCERVVDLIQRASVAAEGDKGKFDLAADHKKAHKLAQESQVLLKNNGILPIKKSANVVFIGEFADKPRYQGGGSSHIKSFKIDSAVDSAVQMGVGARYVKGFSSKNTNYDIHLTVEAIAAAKKADVAVIFAGLPEKMESEGYDRASLGLPDNQNTLISKIAAVQPNTVVVLQNGSPVTMPWLDNVAAVLESYLGGEAIGQAQVEILFGDVNPSGKLAETFPLCLEDTPCYGNFPGNLLTVEHREGIYIGYRYYDKVKKDVLFPFGFGLSYSSFEYSDLSLNQDGDFLNVCFKIKNTSDVAGAETAQVYVSAPELKAFHAPRELKGFSKVYLLPGEEKEIALKLDERAFQFYNPALKTWDKEHGEHLVSVGASSRDIRLTATVDIESPNTAVAYDKDLFPCYYSGQVSNVADEEFSRLIANPIPRANPAPGEKVTVFDTIETAAVKTVWGRRIVATVGKTKHLIHPKKDAIFNNPEFFVSSALDTPILWMARGADQCHELRQGIVDFLNGKHTLKALTAMAKSGLMNVPVIKKLKRHR